MEIKNSKSRLIGSACIIAGTCMGAGMLVLPLITAATGFVTASVLLISIFAGLKPCTLVQDFSKIPYQD